MVVEELVFRCYSYSFNDSLFEKHKNCLIFMFKQFLINLIILLRSQENYDLAEYPADSDLTIQIVPSHLTMLAFSVLTIK